MQTIQVDKKILSKNDKEALKLKQKFKEENVFVINLMSSPGSGKTTFLEHLAAITNPSSLVVIEGDLQTNRDTIRLQKVGIDAYQISTGDTCHLEAFMIAEALEHIDYTQKDFLFIENVGNLVCPASYDLGANMNIVALSVSEGDDKVLKYPTMFLCADAVLITKTDLISYFKFDKDKIKQDLIQLGKDIPLFLCSCKEIQTLHNIFNYFKEQRGLGYVSCHSF